LKARADVPRAVGSGLGEIRGLIFLRGAGRSTTLLQLFMEHLACARKLSCRGV